MDKDYWNQFYRKEHTSNPTPFAQFCLNHIPSESTIIDVGCGNGRDSLFFAAKGHKVVAVDQSEMAIHAVSALRHPAVQAICKDTNSLEPVNAHAIYSRFFLHAIPEEHENKVLDWAYASLQPGGKLLLEVRSKKGLEGHYAFGNGHYRRLVDFKQLLQKVADRGFKVNFSTESKGLAVYKDEDPYVIRIIAQKV